MPNWPVVPHFLARIEREVESIENDFFALIRPLDTYCTCFASTFNTLRSVKREGKGKLRVCLKSLVNKSIWNFDIMVL